MSLVNRFTDFINPVVLRESRQLVRSRFAVGILMLFLLIMVIGSALYTVNIGQSKDFSHGNTLFSILYGILTYAAMLFIPSHTALPMLAQKQSAGMDLLFVSTIPPRSIIWGKMASAFWMMVLMFSVSLPFMVLTIQLRGIGLFEVFTSLALLAIIVLTATIGFLLLVCLPASRVFLSLLSLGYMFLLLTLPSSLLMAFRFGGPGMGPSELWSIVGVTVILLCIGGSLTTALISPAISNRSLAVRITITVCWIIAGIIAAIPSIDLIEVWMGFSCIGAALSMLTTSSEPSTMTRRVQRSVPHNPLLRVLYFPIFTGALNGMTWALAIGFISSLVDKDNSSGFTAFFLYMLVYSLLAIRIRTLPFIAKRFPEKFTWTLAGALVGIGSVTPFIAHFAVYPNRNPKLLWRIGNPFAAFDTNSETHIAFCFCALLVLVILNLRWITRQITGFRPAPIPVPATDEPAAVAPENPVS